MKKFILLLLPLLIAAPAAAQEKCTLGLSDAPAFFGFGLGMSPKEARRAAGGKVKVKDKPESVTYQTYLKKQPPAALSGVRVLYLRFFESKLYQIEVFYREGTRRLESIVDDLSARENLPREIWEIKYGIARLECDGFSITADNFLNPRIELTDPVVKADFDAAQKEKAERKKAEKN